MQRRHQDITGTHGAFGCKASSLTWLRTNWSNAPAPMLTTAVTNPYTVASKASPGTNHGHCKHCLAKQVLALAAHAQPPARYTFPTTCPAQIANLLLFQCDCRCQLPNIAAHAHTTANFPGTLCTVVKHHASCHTCQPIRSHPPSTPCIPGSSTSTYRWQPVVELVVRRLVQPTSAHRESPTCLCQYATVGASRISKLCAHATYRKVMTLSLIHI